MCGKSEGITMGIEIDKVSGNNVAQELAAINKNSAEVKKTEAKKKAEQTDAIKKAKAENEKKKSEVLIDTYRQSNRVSNSIEAQIKEQQAKIDEISKNLEGIKENYFSTDKAEDKARAERRMKENELYAKEKSERSLKRLFYEWRMKHIQKKDNKEIEQTYNTYYDDYDSAQIERKLAEKDYDIADADAFAAIKAHTRADIDYTAALWQRSSAYWDLASMQRRLMLARHIENMNK